MQVKAELSSYEAVQFSITTTANVEEWRAAVKQIDALHKSADILYVRWPLSGFVACIKKMLADLDKTHADVLTEVEDAKI